MPCLKLVGEKWISATLESEPEEPFEWDGLPTNSFLVGMSSKFDQVKRSCLSSPRAESARAVTGRQCPHSGKGEDFLTGQPDFFTETAVTPERKVEKSFPRWEINRHVEG